MAHDLSIRKDGFVEMAYRATDGLPWHSMGNALPDDATLEAWAQAAGFDFRIKRAKVRFPTEADATEMEVDDANHVLFRSDTKAPLAIVGAGFKVVQPITTLEFFRDLVESAGYRICTAGVLKGGRKFWAQADCGLTAEIAGGDVMKGKLLVATSCDGSMKTIVKNVVERVVCANTLAIASKEHGQEVRVSHKSHFNADNIKSQLGIARADFETFISQARYLACESLNVGQADQFLLDLLFTQKQLDASVKDCRDNIGYKRIMALFEHNARGIELAGRTAWGLVNAVTEYVDHHRGNAGTTDSNRRDYAWFGEGDKLKSEAFAKALIDFAN